MCFSNERIGVCTERAGKPRFFPISVSKAGRESSISRDGKFRKQTAVEQTPLITDESASSRYSFVHSIYSLDRVQQLVLLRTPGTFERLEICTVLRPRVQHTYVKTRNRRLHGTLTRPPSRTSPLHPTLLKQSQTFCGRRTIAPRQWYMTIYRVPIYSHIPLPPAAATTAPPGPSGRGAECHFTRRT